MDYCNDNHTYLLDPASGSAGWIVPVQGFLGGFESTSLHMPDASSALPPLFNLSNIDSFCWPGSILSKCGSDSQVRRLFSDLSVISPFVLCVSIAGVLFGPEIATFSEVVLFLEEDGDVDIWRDRSCADVLPLPWPMPESDFTEKLLNKDFPEDILDILVDLNEISIDFIDALNVFSPFIMPLLLLFPLLPPFQLLTPSWSSFSSAWGREAVECSSIIRSS